MAQRDVKIQEALYDADAVKLYIGTPYSSEIYVLTIHNSAQTIDDDGKNNNTGENDFLVYSEFFKGSVNDDSFTGLLNGYEKGRGGIVRYNGIYPSVVLLKGILPPKCWKIEFLKNIPESTIPVILTEVRFYDVDTYGNYIYDYSYYWWSLLRIESKLETETNTAEYILHTGVFNDEAHKHSTETISSETQHETILLKDDGDFFFPKSDESNGSYNAQVINGNLLTKNYQLSYLGNLQKDGTNLDNPEERSLVPTRTRMKMAIGMQGFIVTYQTISGRLIEPIVL